MRRAAVIAVAVGLAGAGCGEPGPPPPPAAEPEAPAAGDPAAAPLPDGPGDDAFAGGPAQIDGHLIRPAKAGRWYPASAAACRAKLAAMLAAAPAPAPPVPGRPVALIAPHAGWRFSGPIAAAGFKAVAAHRFDTVVIVGLFHKNTIGFTGMSVLADGAMETPLGRAAVDTELAAEIAHGAGGAPFVPAAFTGEHSIELVLPFVQYCWPDARIVPVMVKSTGYADDHRFATALAGAIETLDRRVLLVASTDLAHGASHAVTRRVDDATMASWTTLRPWIVRWAARRWTPATAPGLTQAMCGRDPVFAVLWAARQLGATRVSLVARATSYDTPHQTSGSAVGYGAAVMSAAAPTREQQQAMIDLARAAALAAFGHGAKPDPQAVPLPEGIAPGGAFVTLRRDGRLHGCIGRMSGAGPLGRLLADVAASAAHDPRTADTALDAATARSLRVEISLLGALEQIRSPDAVVLGVHGVKVVAGSGAGAKGATFLPQVAPEQGWDHARLFERLAAKAGLPRIDWDDPDTRVYRYTAFVFAG